MAYAGSTWDDVINKRTHDPDGRVNSSYYEFAYKDSLFATWQYTPFKLDIAEMSYQKAMAVFGQTGQTAEEARRELLYQYLKYSNFSSTKQDDVIKSMFPTLPTSNSFVNRIIKNIANIYINMPLRSYEGNGTELLEETLTEASYNSTMLNTYRKAKLNGECLVRPRIRRGKLTYQILTPESYRVTKDEHGNILEYWRPYYEYVVSLSGVSESKLRFEVWTLEEFKILDGEDEHLKPIKFTQKTQRIDTTTNGIIETENEYTSFPNPYKDYKGNPIIPIAILNFSQNDDDGTEESKDNYELVKTQLESNLMDFITKENYIYNSIGFWVMMNIDMENSNIPIGNSRGIVMQGVQEPVEGGNAMPSIEHVTADGVYNELIEANKTVLTQRMRDAGLPESMVSQNPGIAASGAAMQIDWRELIETRKEDYGVLKRFENELINLTAMFLNFDSASTLKGKFKSEIIVTIDYVEQSFNDWAEKKESNDYKRRNGLITVKEYVEQMAGVDTILDDDEAIEYMNNNINKFEGVKSNDSEGTGTETIGFDESDTKQTINAEQSEGLTSSK